MRVRADDRGDATVEPARDRDLLARRLGVEVDDDHTRAALRLVDERIDDLERRVRNLLEEEDPEEVHDGHGRAVARRENPETAARRPAVQVRGPEDALGLGEIGAELRAPPDVVPERHDVGAGGEQPLGQARRDTRPVGRVLAVHDAKVDAELVAKRR